MGADRFVRQHGWALALALLGGCAFLGGQTGEDSAETSGGLGGTPTCSQPAAIAFDEVSKWGFSGSTMLDQYGGTWNGISRTSSGTAPDSLVGTAAGDTFPLTFSISYSGGVVLESDCVDELEVDVEVTLEVGDAFISRTGKATLDGNLAEVLLEVNLAPADDGSQETATLLLALRPDGTATGTISLGDWWATLSATRSP